MTYEPSWTFFRPINIVDLLNGKDPESLSDRKKADGPYFLGQFVESRSGNKRDSGKYAIIFSGDDSDGERGLGLLSGREERVGSITLDRRYIDDADEPETREKLTLKIDRAVPTPLGLLKPRTIEVKIFGDYYGKVDEVKRQDFRPTWVPGLEVQTSEDGFETPWFALNPSYIGYLIGDKQI